MGTRSWVVAALVAVAAGCSNSNGSCRATCTADERCTPRTGICVTDLPPELTVATPVEGQQLSASPVEVKGTATDDEAPPKLEVSVGTGAWTPVTPGADGGFSVQLALPAADGDAVGISVRATDSKGREVKVTRAVVVDTVPPACAITSPADGAVVSSLGKLAVTLNASDGSLALVNPRISTDGALTFGPVSGTSGSYSFELPLGPENGVAHELVFRVEDGAGHLCEARSTVTVDNVNPTVGFASPDAGGLLGPAFFAAGGVVSGPVSDGTRQLKSVTLSFADAGVRAATVQGTEWSISIPAPDADDFLARTATVVATDLADNTASATLELTVDVVAPVLAITAPVANAKLNAGSFAGGNNAPLAWTVSDGDPQRAVALALPDGGALSPPLVATSAADNPKTYQPTLVAVDRAGNSSTASVTFSVDRVAPTMTPTPGNNARMHAGPASANFSEPVMGGNGLSLTPSAAGTWTTSQQWTVPALAKDTVYSGSTGPVTDLHGNPVVGSSFNFHTETWVPASGATLATGYLEAISAVTDQEGAIWLVAKHPSDKQFWILLSPTDGTLSAYASTAFTTKNLVAARTVNPDLSSRRLGGVTTVGPAGNLLVYKVGANPMAVAEADAFIPTPAFASEGTGLGEFGLIRDGGYERSGRARVPVSLASIDAVHLSPVRWELVEYRAVEIKSQTFGCHASGVVGIPPVCELRGATSLLGTATFDPSASAISSNCSAQQLNDLRPSTTNFIPWQHNCGFNCYPEATTPGFPRQIVADQANDGTFYSVEGTGPYQVRKAVVSASCVGAWTNIGAALTLPTQPRLVVIRGNPGLIYADASGNLKFVTP